MPRPQGTVKIYYARQNGQPKAKSGEKLRFGKAQPFAFLSLAGIGFVPLAERGDADFTANQ